MNYGSDCGCSAPAPKPVKTIGVQPLAPTEEIVCPDSRCMPHLLNSLAVTDDAVPNYVGVYKGQSYIAPIRAAVDSVLKESLNGLYKSGQVPVITSARDLEAIPVLQKGNCEKIAITSMPVIAEAMMASLPAAPAGYEPIKVMTTDKEGDVYLASPSQVVSPGLIPAIIENCEKGKIVNVPVLDRILGFGKKCGEFGSTTLAQLQEALAKVVPVAAPETLPTYLRGFLSADEERKYPVTVSKQFASSVKLTISQDIATKWTGVAQTLPPGLYAVTANFSGDIATTTGGTYFGLLGTMGAGPNNKSNVFTMTSVAGGKASAGVSITAFVRIPSTTPINVSLQSSTGVAVPFTGWVDVDVMQLAELNLAINGVF